MPRLSIPQVWGSIQALGYCPTLFLFASYFIDLRWRVACLGCFLFSLVCFVWGNPCGGGECTNRGRSSVHLLACALNFMGSASEYYGAVTHPHSASHLLGAPLLPPFFSYDLCQMRPFTLPPFGCSDREL